MPNDITFEIKRVLAEDTSQTNKDPGEQLGDLVAAYITQKLGTRKIQQLDPKGVGRRSARTIVKSNQRVQMPRTGYVHVLAMPGTVQDAKNLTGPTWNPPIYEEDPHSGGVEFLHSWVALSVFLAQEIQDEFAREHEVTLTWEEAQQSLWSKVSQRFINADDLLGSG